MVGRNHTSKNILHSIVEGSFLYSGPCGIGRELPNDSMNGNMTDFIKEYAKLYHFQNISIFAVISHFLSITFLSFYFIYPFLSLLTQAANRKCSQVRSSPSIGDS